MRGGGFAATAKASMTRYRLFNEGRRAMEPSADAVIRLANGGDVANMVALATALRQRLPEPIANRRLRLLTLPEAP